MHSEAELRDQAASIWWAGVDAVRPALLVARAIQAFPPEWQVLLTSAPTIRVVGCGKAGAAMAEGLEQTLQPHLDRVTGLVNIPEGSSANVHRVRLHAARPAGSNHPTAAGVHGAEQMLRLMEEAGPDDVAICLISGGGSALLPAPATGITLEEKQLVTRLLHASGATIGEMNAVRKHLSRIKGGQLASSFRGRLLVSLIISDVVGDPLDVIASGPTAPDPTTFAEAYGVLKRHQLLDRVPAAVIDRLRQGMNHEIPDTLKAIPESVHNLVIGSNAVTLRSSADHARHLGYNVLDLGPYLEGDTDGLARVMAGVICGIKGGCSSVTPPVCLISGGETTVALNPGDGVGGRNQQFGLAMLSLLGEQGLKGICVLSGGTDGEDGPTDAAGSIVSSSTARTGKALGLDLATALRRHDAYHYLDRSGGLFRTGLTGTNVMDLRVILIAGS